VNHTTGEAVQCVIPNPTIPAGLILKHVGANIPFPTITTPCGLIITLQGLVTSYQGLLAVQFFLRLGMIPVILFVMSKLYRRDQIQPHVTLIFTGVSLAAFSGMLASAILGIDRQTGHRGEQWVLILVCDSFQSSLGFQHHHCWQRSDCSCTCLHHPNRSLSCWHQAPQIVHCKPSIFIHPLPTDIPSGFVVTHYGVCSSYTNPCDRMGFKSEVGAEARGTTDIQSTAKLF